MEINNQLGVETIGTLEWLKDELKNSKLVLKPDPDTYYPAVFLESKDGNSTLLAFSSDETEVRGYNNVYTTFYGISIFSVSVCPTTDNKDYMYAVLTKSAYDLAVQVLQKGINLLKSQF